MFADTDDDNDWSGVLLSSLPRLGPGSDLPQQHPAPHPSPKHTVCIELPVQDQIRPHPPVLRDVWDGDHVRLPWSRENLYPVQDEHSSAPRKILVSRWDLIIKALTSSPIKNSRDLEEAILSYNPRYRGHYDWNFDFLHKLFTEEFSEEENENFFSVTLPRMIEMLVSSPSVITSPLPLLSQGSNHSITLSQTQVSVLLINAFFCTFPRRNTTKPGSEFINYPFINFNSLYGGESKRPKAMLEKLKCLFCYFSRICNFPATGVVTFTRRSITRHSLPDWSESTRSWSKLHVTSQGMIETEGAGMLQVDFANKYVGGGVLRSGLVQEEIRFTVCPELLVSMLFTEVLGDTEVLIIIGVEQFSRYTGYADSFMFAGRCHDNTPLDSSGRRETSIVAMDALRLDNNQFSRQQLDRELNKAYVGFYHNNVSRLQAVATGNWGCGAFGGDLRLKFLTQLMAASENNRDVAYFTFGDEELVRDAGKMYRFLIDRDIKVGDLYKCVCKYGSSRRHRNGEDLFYFIYEEFKAAAEAYDAETDEETEVVNDPERRLSEKVTEDDMNKLKEYLKDNEVEKKNINGNSEVHTPNTKNDGFLATLDKMERGEFKGVGAVKEVDDVIETAEEGVKSKDQSKMTDFFKKKQ